MLLVNELHTDVSISQLTHPIKLKLDWGGGGGGGSNYITVQSIEWRAAAGNIGHDTGLLLVMCHVYITCHMWSAGSYVTFPTCETGEVQASDWSMETCTALLLADKIQTLECSWSKFPWKQISSVSFDFEMRVAFVRLFWKFHKPLKCLSKHCWDPKNAVKCNNYCLLMAGLRGWTRAAQCDKKSEKCL